MATDFIRSTLEALSMQGSSDDPFGRLGPRDVYKPSKHVLDTLSDEERLVCLWKKVGFSSQDIAEYWGLSSASVDELFARAQERVVRARVEQLQAYL
jgi:DNA-directed RNA polymerase specialized sigma24 family protein